MNEEIKAGVYLRVSTSYQNAKNELAGCTRYCEARGWEFLIFEETGRSAYKSNVCRPVRDHLLDQARRGDVSHIVVWALDRWTRQGGEALLRDLDILASYGCQLHSVQESWLDEFAVPGELGMHLRRFVAGVVGWMARQESERKGERVKASIRYRQALKDDRVGRPSADIDIDRVLELRAIGWSLRRLAEEFNVGRGTIERICNNRMSQNGKTKT